MYKKVKEVRALIIANDRILAATTFDGGRVTCDLPKGLVLPMEDSVEAIKRIVLQTTHYEMVDIDPISYNATFTRLAPGPIEGCGTETVDVSLYKGSAGVKESVYHAISKAAWLTPRQMLTELKNHDRGAGFDPMDEFVLQFIERLL